MERLKRRAQRRAPRGKALPALRVGTDCSGIDSPIIALDLLGMPYVHVFSSETDPQARDFISRVHRPERMFSDITERTRSEVRALAPIDLYVAGPPCQPFSQLNHAARGWDDERSEVLDACVDTILELKPKVWILENSPSLIGSLHAPGWRSRRAALLRVYVIDELLINTRDYGLPQNRKRLYMVGTLPSISHGQQIASNLERLAIPDVIPIRRLLPRREQGDPVPVPPTHAWKLKRIPRGAKDGILVLRDHYKDRNEVIVLDVSRPVVTKSSCFFCISHNRMLNCYDLALLQGVPKSIAQFLVDNYTNNMNLRLIGNAMSVNVLCALFLTIFT